MMSPGGLFGPPKKDKDEKPSGDATQEFNRNILPSHTIYRDLRQKPFSEYWQESQKAQEGQRDTNDIGAKLIKNLVNPALNMGLDRVDPTGTARRMIGPRKLYDAKGTGTSIFNIKGPLYKKPLADPDPLKPKIKRPNAGGQLMTTTTPTINQSQQPKIPTPIPAKITPIQPQQRKLPGIVPTLPTSPKPLALPK